MKSALLNAEASTKVDLEPDSVPFLTEKPMARALLRQPLLSTLFAVHLSLKLDFKSKFLTFSSNKLIFWILKQGQEWPQSSQNLECHWSNVKIQAGYVAKSVLQVHPFLAKSQGQASKMEKSTHLIDSHVSKKSKSPQFEIFPQISVVHRSKILQDFFKSCLVTWKIT